VNANRLACKLCAGAGTEIREASPAELRTWDDLVRRFANYRIAHTRGWVRSLEESTGGRPLYLLFEKDGEVVGCLPGLVICWGLLHLFGSPLPGWQTTSMGPAFDPQRLSTRELITTLIPYLQERHRIAAGCDTFDLMGLGEFKTKFGANLDSSKHRWVRSRYRWLTRARSLAKACHQWQQSIRGRLARLHRRAALKLFG
jgi:hypothetical protein